MARGESISQVYVAGHAIRKLGGVGRQHLGRRGVLVVWAAEECFSGHPGHDSENGGAVWPWRRGRDHG